MTFFYFLPEHPAVRLHVPVPRACPAGRRHRQRAAADPFHRLVRGILLKGNDWADLWPSIWPLLVFTARGDGDRGEVLPAHARLMRQAAARLPRRSPCACRVRRLHRRSRLSRTRSASGRALPAGRQLAPNRAPGVATFVPPGHSAPNGGRCSASPKLDALVRARCSKPDARTGAGASRAGPGGARRARRR